jgi:FtsH-binding integral membrane protein
LSPLWLSMWSWSSRFSSKPTWQTSHLNLWFPASLSWCRFNSELVRKALLQLVQTKVVLLLWALICLSMLAFEKNTLPYNSQLYLLVPFCLNSCCFRPLSERNSLEQQEYNKYDLFMA